MHYLVDGHNLIAGLDSISLDDPDDEAKLTLLLRSWTAAGPNRWVTVFFDGGLPGGQDAQLSTPRVEVIFATAGSTADQLLINRIRNASNPQEFVLVSSDREVKRAAAMKKMRMMSARAFSAQLIQNKQPAAVKDLPVPSKSDDPSLDEEEISEWLRIFNEEGEDDSQAD